ncbi:MAG: oxidoreductase [Armatimonadetes bacterium CG_4_9_14_3_um_filter_58_7]|nr:MAG: oxidoreductase [Armatimonadetes bacterium CG_4_9_14_3_um_filter_58_7]
MCYSLSTEIAMKHRTLGNTDLEISPITLGTRTFGDCISEKDAIRLVHYAVDRGINCFDTADVYGTNGNVPDGSESAAETILGTALDGRRDHIRIITKAGQTNGADAGGAGLDEAHIRSSVETSLSRLRTDCIDLFLFDTRDSVTPVEKIVATGGKLVAEGKVRHYGLSNFTAWQVAETVWAAEDTNNPLPVAAQLNYSLLRRSQEMDLFQACKQYGLAVMSYQTLQGGLLAGHYRKDQPAPIGSRAQENPNWMPDNMTDECWHVVETVRILAMECRLTPAQFTLAWTLSQPDVTAVALGARTVEHVDEAITAVDAEIPTDHLRKINRLTAGRRLLV